MYLRNTPSASLPVPRRLSGGLGSLGDTETSYVTSAPPNPPALTAGPNPQLVQSPVSQNPLDYVSPQSAVAAGLDPATVEAAWSKQVNSYASVTAAVNAGIPPGVVTELWNGGTPTPAPVPWWRKYAIPLLAGAAAGALILAGHDKEAR